MNNELAPVGITVYKRLDHLKKTIEALQKNDLAEETELFIFSDAPQIGDEEAVGELREYLKSIHGFKSVTITHREVNSRVNNNRGGQRLLLDRYGKMIWMAEDIVSAPGFLRFMNEALNTYKERKDILCISGYTPPMQIPQEYKEEVLLLDRMYGWSLGIWREKYDAIKPFTPEELEDFFAHAKRYEALVKKGEEGLINFMKLDAQKLFYGLDIRANFLLLKENLYTLMPKQSLVFNTGLDGSGLHCGKSNAFDVVLSEQRKFFCKEDITVCDAVLQSHGIFRNAVRTSRIMEEVFAQLSKNLKKDESYCILGTNIQQSLLFLEYCQKNGKSFNVSSIATKHKEPFYKSCGYKVESIQEALQGGEKRFVILSLGNKNEIKAQLLAIDPSLDIIYYEPIDADAVVKIEKKIRDLKIKSASIWGVDNISEAFVHSSTIGEVKINHYIDSSPKEGQTYKGMSLITPQEALERGERNFIILSLNHKEEMQRQLLALSPEALCITVDD